VCDKCTDLRTKKVLAKTSTERVRIKKEMRAHTQLHRSDRKLFWNRRERSAMQPTVQWSILSDSTSRFAIPNIAPLPKGWSSLRRLPITVFGLINFALRYRSIIPYLGVWPQTPNFTISLMYMHFVSMLSRPDCPRAPELNETSDGSPKEYKNISMLCFAAFKVLINWFPTVNHYYLHPGHSHDLQDQAWATMKTNFYQRKTITWEDFLDLTRKCFSTIKPEIITQLFVFDWTAWFRPWMRKLKNHRDWRAFSFRKHPTDPSSVLMKWKQSESSVEDFHGSDEHPDGIEILLEIPLSQPERIFPNPLDPSTFPDINQTFTSMTAEQRTWWEELIEICELPDTPTLPIPDNYFDFKRFDYDTWLENHPYQHREPVSFTRVIPPVEVDETSGIAAIGDRIIELCVGDMVSIRNDENTFFIAKVRKIVAPPVGEDETKTWYQVWYYEPTISTADPCHFRTKWKLLHLRDNPVATSILSLNHFLTVKFKLTRTMCLRKETLELIKTTQLIDVANINPDINNTDNEYNENREHDESSEHSTNSDNDDSNNNSNNENGDDDDSNHDNNFNNENNDDEVFNDNNNNNSCNNTNSTISSSYQVYIYLNFFF
jgi:hypothetical protein